MTEQAPDNASARIERALLRIEAGAKRLADDRGDIARRHAALRDHVAAALASLDSLIAEED